MEKAPPTQRKSARHARQRFEEEKSSSSSSSSESERSSSSSSSEDDQPSAPIDPRNPLFPQPKFAGGGVLVQKKRQVQKRSRIARPMHTGDDEGREPAKRVRRPPPQPEDDEEAGGGGPTAPSAQTSSRRRTDEEDDGNEEDDDDDSDAESLGVSDSFSSSSDNATNSRRRSQRATKQPDRLNVDNDLEDDDDQQPSSRPPRASAAAVGPHRVRLSRCWLCTFANCKMARRIAEFVSVNAGTMDPAIMADQIKAEVKREVSRC